MRRWPAGGPAGWIKAVKVGPPLLAGGAERDCAGAGEKPVEPSHRLLSRRAIFAGGKSGPVPRWRQAWRLPRQGPVSGSRGKADQAFTPPPSPADDFCRPETGAGAAMAAGVAIAPPGAGFKGPGESRLGLRAASYPGGRFLQARNRGRCRDGGRRGDCPARSRFRGAGGKAVWAFTPPPSPEDDFCRREIESGAAMAAGVATAPPGAGFREPEGKPSRLSHRRPARPRTVCRRR